MKLLSLVRLLATPWILGPLGSSIHGIFQARVLEWGVIAPSFGAFPHSVAFKEVSGHQVHFKSGPGNRGHSVEGASLAK